MKEWRVNFVYKIILFLLFLIGPVFLINIEKNAELYVRKYMYFYGLELIILLCSYFMYEIRIKGYYNKLVKKALQVNEKFSLKNENYKKFMGLDSFSSFEYFFNEELDKLGNELQKYKDKYDNMEMNKEKEVKTKDEKLEFLESELENKETEGKLLKKFLNDSTEFLDKFRKGVKNYNGIFEELTFYLKNYFDIESLCVVKKDKDSFKTFSNLSNEREGIPDAELRKLEGLEGGIYIHEKFNMELGYDVIAPIKGDGKLHGFLFLNLKDKRYIEKDSLLMPLKRIYQIFLSIIELYYDLQKKDLVNDKANKEILRLKSELKETDENLDVHLEQMSNMYEEIVTLYEVGKKIGKIYDKDDIEEAILNTLLEITETEFALIYNYEKDKLNIGKLINISDDELIVGFKENEILSQLFFDMKKAEKAIIVNDLKRLENFSELPGEIKNKIKNFVEVPIIIGQEIKGGVILFNKEDEFTAANINLVTSLINQMSISVQNIDYFKKEIDRQKEEEQLKIASNIQSGLFPQKMPVLSNAGFFGLNIPAKAVGGDYYDLVQIDDEKVIGFVADVSGKGIPASLLVSIVRTIFRMTVEEFKEYSPDKILSRINNVLLKENLEGRFVTAACFMLDSDKRIIETSSAGHDPFLLYKSSDQSMTKFPSSSIVLGVMEDEFEKDIIEYEENDVILFYTDGVVEARKETGEFYTLERLEEVLRNNFDLDAKGIVSTIYSELREFVEEAKQNDDITLLAIKGEKNKNGDA